MTKTFFSSQEEYRETYCKDYSKKYWEEYPWTSLKQPYKKFLENMWKKDPEYYYDFRNFRDETLGEISVRWRESYRIKKLTQEDQRIFLSLWP